MNAREVKKINFLSGSGVSLYCYIQSCTKILFRYVFVVFFSFPDRLKESRMDYKE